VDLVIDQARFSRSSLMNLIDALTTRGISLAGDRPFGLNRTVDLHRLGTSALIALPAETTIRSLRLGRKMLSVLLPAAENHRLGACAACGVPVTQSDPFIRYRGEYYHAHGCAETNPPALSRREARAGLTST
jgi:hypothetical protein